LTTKVVDTNMAALMAATVTAANALDLVADSGRTRIALQTPRPQILALARDPISATGIAARLELPRQRVNYHVRRLAAAGFLRRAGRRQRRGLQEQLWSVTARAFVLAPGVLGPEGDAAAMVPGADSSPTAASTGASAAAGTAGLLLLTARMQHELGHACRQTNAGGAAPPVFAVDSELSFRSAAQRAEFAAALTKALTRVIAEHTEPTARSRRFRLVLGCYPLPTPP
jgi:hypothetical protein